MKSIKVLSILLVITAITNFAHMYAYGYSVMTITNQNVPGNNGSWDTSNIYIDTSEMGRHHYIDSVSVTRELDYTI